MTTPRKATAAAEPTETNAPTVAAEPAPLVVLLSRVMEEVGAVRKAQRNEQQHYIFRGIDAVVNAVSPALRKHGVIVLPRLIDISHEATTARSGGGLTITRVLVEYTFHGPLGDSFAVIVPGESMDSGDKSTPKAMSVAFRIALLQALALPTDDTDPDAQTYERGTPGQARQQPLDGSAHFERAKTAIENATDLAFLGNLNATVQEFDRNGTFTPEQAGTLYEMIEAKRAALDVPA